MPLDLSLPEPPRKSNPRGLAFATFGLTLAAVVLLIVVLSRTNEPGVTPRNARVGLNRELAVTLEKRTLWREAAALWENLAVNGEDLFRAGKCRMLAGEPEQAARNLLAAEALGLSEALARESNRLVLEAYAMLGKFDVRNQALERRTGGGAKEESQAVARVGEERITREELLAVVRDEEAAKLLRTGSLDRDALDRAVSARTADPRLLMPTLSRLLSTRALALSALARGLGDSPVLARRLSEIRREFLANLLVEDRLMEGVRISESDIEDYWKAHPDRYTSPVAARFSWGADPASLTGVEGWHEKGAAFPEGAAPSAEADALLFALKPGEVSDRAVPIGDRKVFLRLEEQRPARVTPLAEARDRVTSDLLARKRNETIEALRREVKSAHPIEVVDPKLRQAYEAGGAGER